MSVFDLHDLLIEEVLKRKPMHRKFLLTSVSLLTQAERVEAAEYIAFMTSDGVSVSELANAYLLIIEDTFKEELYFREVGHYRYSSFQEAKRFVYDNTEYMTKYMIGLALSSFWWVNHVRLHRFFKSQLPLLSENRGLYREIGPGHGIYFLESLRSNRFDRYQGIDISSASVHLTQRLLARPEFENLPPSEILQMDFLESGGLDPSAALVMGEVLEHVEDPGLFLDRARQTSSESGSVYLTTCVNAPAIDHLYNPGTIEDLESLFIQHGFTVVERCAFGVHELSIEECTEKKLAINVGYLLRKTKRTTHSFNKS
jgi:2-polyprenyl-3-methyl-5-hydroxy-6-metoxy-1,4-benzoquinol methylase